MEHYSAPDWAWIAVAVLAGLLAIYSAWCYFRPATQRAPVDDNSTHDDHSAEQGDNSTYIDQSVTSHNAQPGSVTAHSVTFVAETPPGVTRQVIKENEKRGDEYVTTLRLDLQGRPPLLGIKVKADHLRMLNVAQYVPPGGVGTSMLQVYQEETFMDGRTGKAIANPNPGSYLAEVYSSEPETALEIETFVG
jgi:hypothetical protein